MRSAGFEAGDSERQQGFNIVNAAVKANVQHFIWSYVVLGRSMSVDVEITFRIRTAEHTEHKIPYYETKSVVALIGTAVFVSETTLQSRRSRLSSGNANELHIDTACVLLLGAYVSLSLLAHNNLIKHF